MRSLDIFAGSRCHSGIRESSTPSYPALAISLSAVSIGRCRMPYVPRQNPICGAAQRSAAQPTGGNAGLSSGQSSVSPCSSTYSKYAQGPESLGNLRWRAVYDYFFADFNAHQVFADFQGTGICFSS